MMAALSAALGINRKEEEEKSIEDEERDGGMKLNSLQASMQDRSKVWPVGMMAGSNMRDNEMGQMKLIGVGHGGGGGSPIPIPTPTEEGDGEQGAELEIKEDRWWWWWPKVNFFFHRDLVAAAIGISFSLLSLSLCHFFFYSFLLNYSDLFD